MKTRWTKYLKCLAQSLAPTNHFKNARKKIKIRYILPLALPSG